MQLHVFIIIGSIRNIVTRKKKSIIRNRPCTVKPVQYTICRAKSSRS